MNVNKKSISGAAHLYAKQSRAIEVNRKTVDKDVKRVKTTKAAEVSLSAEAKELAKTTQVENSKRHEQLSNLKAQIKAGTYQPKAEDVAESILRHFMGADYED